jgi:hypothetical protein
MLLVPRAGEPETVHVSVAQQAILLQEEIVSLVTMDAELVEVHLNIPALIVYLVGTYFLIKHAGNIAEVLHIQVRILGHARAQAITIQTVHAMELVATGIPLLLSVGQLFAILDVLLGIISIKIPLA